MLAVSQFTGRVASAPAARLLCLSAQQLPQPLKHRKSRKATTMSAKNANKNRKSLTGRETKRPNSFSPAPTLLSDVTVISSSSIASNCPAKVPTVRTASLCHPTCVFHQLAYVSVIEAKAVSFAFCFRRRGVSVMRLR